MKFLERQLEDPARLTRLKRWFYAGLAVVALSEIAAPYVFHEEHAEFAFENLPAWESVYGLISCAAIIIGSKLLGKLWLMRREDYYDR
ncbi:MAG: hypothetical protein A3G76_13580 [Acidobacteria bacterium RIFCSPLOWO2_12_FULL_65_11]|nr:MAG: hypothetical protein A3H95_00095 [Acidobacteria bacterium RIFCSPLOWO2_02_FULL_64_15]OFW28091.1 MAG: hypothetical protein A3G76_13580 [Acidobacteria bacterium RIFCSPLOWO2_12_FULL_65_11]